MKLKILAIGHKMPAWIQTGIDDYLKRLQPYIHTEIIELTAAKRQKNESPSTIERYGIYEGELILNEIKPQDVLIALEVGGKQLSTEKLALQLQNWQLDGKNVCIAIGGPDGLSQAVKKHAQWHWSLSPLTLPHPLVRVILAEQLYRAASINTGHPYHRA